MSHVVEMRELSRDGWLRIKDDKLIVTEVEREATRFPSYRAATLAAQTYVANLAPCIRRYIDFGVRDAPKRGGDFNPADHITITPILTGEQQ